MANKLDFPLFESNWTSLEELLLFEGLERYFIFKKVMVLGIGTILQTTLELGKLDQRSNSITRKCT